MVQAPVREAVVGVLLLLANAVIGTPESEDDLVTSLPGVSLTFKLYSGYIQVFHSLVEPIAMRIM